MGSTTETRRSTVHYDSYNACENGKHYTTFMRYHIGMVSRRRRVKSTTSKFDNITQNSLYSYMKRRHNNNRTESDIHKHQYQNQPNLVQQLQQQQVKKNGWIQTCCTLPVPPFWLWPCHWQGPRPHVWVPACGGLLDGCWHRHQTPWWSGDWRSQWKQPCLLVVWCGSRK